MTEGRGIHHHWLRIPAWLRTAVTLAVLLWGGWLAAPAFVEDPRVPLKLQTPVREYRDEEGQLLWLERTYDCQWRQPVKLQEISPHFIEAILAIEDHDFFQHGALSYNAILRAAWMNLAGGRVLSGASTLTMQLVALPYAGRRKTLPMKLRQMLCARRLASVYSKELILEEYVNRIPFGGKIYGIEAASQYYFDKPASKLERHEAVLLAGLPQRPNRFRPDRHSEKAKHRQQMVLDAMQRQGILSAQEAAALYATPLLYRDFTLPSLYVRHAHPQEYQFLREARREQGESGQDGLTVTIDTVLQNEILDILKETVGGMPGVRDGAAILADARTGHVLAMVGTLDFQEKTAGQVNVATSRRSVGSTLKPFIYAEAIEGGLISDTTALLDAPVRLGNYSPVNYDGTYSGWISARKALSDSLNLPAIRLLKELGVPRMTDTFAKLSLDTSRCHDDLTLALGTAPQSLQALVRAYTALAGDGSMIPLSFLADRTPAPRRIFSPGTAAMVADILRTKALPSCTADAAWKTGTSNGLKDAWCIAFTPDYVLGVWFGNKNGRASHWLVGGKCAAPAAGRIMSLLYSGDKKPEWPPLENTLDRINVCAKSGRPLSLHCKESTLGLVLKAFRPRPCTRCGQAERLPLTILTPKPQTYLAKDAQGTALPLKASKPNAHWYIDGRYKGIIHENTTTTFLPGRHVLQAMDLDDAHGKTASVEFVVQTDNP